MSKKPISIVVAIDASTYGIGHQGKIPWYSPKDLSYFKSVTLGNPPSHKKNAVIMGRITWDSIKKPLAGRVNIVVSTTLKPDSLMGGDLVFVKSFEQAIMLCEARRDIDDIFAIGGVNIYKEALKYTLLRRVYITEVYNNNTDTTYDSYFPMDEFKARKPIALSQEEDIDKNLKLVHILYCPSR
jgi:dihydrofolate reductase